MKRLLTRQEAAERLKIGLRTLDRRLATGDIPCYRLGEGPRPPVRISEEQLAAYLERINSGGHQQVRRSARAIIRR